jgi:hypothetical protein
VLAFELVAELVADDVSVIVVLDFVDDAVDDIDVVIVELPDSLCDEESVDEAEILGEDVPVLVWVELGEVISQL